jgi:hypothetical protein
MIYREYEIEAFEVGRSQWHARFRRAGAGLRSRAHAVGEGLKPAASTRFELGRRGNLQILSHRPLVSRCGRRNRPGKSSSPPPFASL